MRDRVEVETAAMRRAAVPADRVERKSRARKRRQSSRGRSLMRVECAYSARSRWLIPGENAEVFPNTVALSA
jgi:hypothetical protein